MFSLDNKINFSGDLFLTIIAVSLVMKAMGGAPNNVYL